MRVRLIAPALLVGLVTAHEMLVPAPAKPVQARTECGDPFDPVWDIMTQDRGSDSMGCRGCHIGPQPGFGPWFGDTKEDVRATFETGINPDGDDLGVIPVDGGRDGQLGQFLHNNIMPLFGTYWGDDELALLDAWLITYE